VPRTAKSADNFADAAIGHEAEESLIGTLPSLERLALAYAPARARVPTMALFALDSRLAGLLRHSREPMLAQLRLAWWRETLGQGADAWPAGEPLLAALRSWNGGHTALARLVNGWEALTGPAPLPRSALEDMIIGRAEAFAALAGALGARSEENAARKLGRRWALTDLAMRLSNADERGAVREMLEEEAGRIPKVSRALRPLLVLQGLAERRFRLGSEAAAQSPAAMLKAMRLGFLGF
jgi:phytoene synthase